MPFLTSLLILVIVTRLLGRLCMRIQQPAIIGEMMAGVLLGPALLGLIRPNAALQAISDLSVFLIILSAGLEMNFREITSALRGRGLVIAVMGFVIPLLAGIVVGLCFGLDVMRTVFLGLAVSITALPVAVRILDSFGLLQSDIARYTIASAIFSDLAALLILGVILNLPNQGSFVAVALGVFITGGKLVVLAAIILTIDWLIHRMRKRGVRIQRIPEKLIRIFGNEALFGIVVAFVLAFGSLSEVLDFHFVVGAFFGALLIDRHFFSKERYEELEKTIASVTGGFLAPLFFAYLGLEFDLQTITGPAFVIVLLVVSVGSKVLAGWFGARLTGMPHTPALGIGLILNGRGVMGLVIAGIAYERKFIDKGLFSTLVLMSIVTTVLAPILFRKFIVPALETQPKAP